ncbi:MAG: decarboxylating 6-phosphogluconate dehydrogenase [Acidobacteria bacterium]|nr:decarboxylating 6-phosphogluconate dehydrogenase [Acidobacteriota bacterium]
MELAIIGLGKMGLNMCKRLLRDKHTVHAYDPASEKIAEAVAAGGVALARLEDLPKLRAPRTVWVMVPSGEPTRQVIERLATLLASGDVVIDGGNSYYKDSVERYSQLKARGIHFLDAGTSGGVWGLEVGYCLMVGGDTEVFARAEPVFRSLAPKDGYALVGGPGTGHFTKMVHNGIEYGLMQAYAEGFEILRASNQKLNLQQISHLWNQGSVVRSWLLELAERAFAKDPDLTEIQGYVQDSGEGRWTILAAMEHDVPAPVITLSLLTRFRSRQRDSFTAKVLAALRAQFGGHAVKTVGKS